MKAIATQLSEISFSYWYRRNKNGKETSVVWIQRHVS
jgi:hypothetical protein